MPRTKIHTEHIRAESRAKILTTARRVFAEQGVDGCTMADIARRAGMSQGNIYWYFASKDDLLKAVLNDAFAALDALLAEVAAFPGDTSEQLAYLVDRYIAFGREQGGADMTIILFSLTTPSRWQRLSDLDVDLNQVVQSLHRAVSTILAQAQATGTLRPEIDLDQSTTFFFSFFNGLVLTYQQDAHTIPRDTLRAAVLRLLGSVTG
jgi:AcrR family transcriptional regulator